MIDHEPWCQSYEPDPLSGARRHCDCGAEVTQRRWDAEDSAWRDRIDAQVDGSYYNAPWEYE